MEDERKIDSYSILTYYAQALPRNYKPLIYAKWLRTYRSGNEILKKIDKSAYFPSYHRYLENVLSQPKSQVRLAVLSDDFDIVLGFLVYRDNILDYVFVNKDQRMLGIATKLLPPGIEKFTHLTKTGDIIWKKHYKDWKFNPFI